MWSGPLSTSRFNPSQVGYKRIVARVEQTFAPGFNPSQVGYKLVPSPPPRPQYIGFNPSQVGYKLGLMEWFGLIE